MTYQTDLLDHAATPLGRVADGGARAADGECMAHGGNARAPLSVRFAVPGMPQGKGRPKAVKIAGRTRLATPAKTAAYEGLIAHAAQVAMNGMAPIEGPVAAAITIRCPVPASWSGKKQRQALAGEILPTTKPDADNVVKAIFDGCNGVTFRDDVQVVDLRLRKRYHAVPGVSVEFLAIELGPKQASLEPTP